MINFKSKITKKVLGYFLLNTEAELYLNEIAKKFAVDRGNLVKKLAEWQKERILEKSRRGNLSLYKINPSYPFLNELRGWARKSFGLEEELRSELKKINGLKEAYIFGSYAQNTMTPDSDIDLLLVGEHVSLDATRRIIPFMKKYDREINITDYTSKEFEVEKNKNDFLRAIFKKKTIKLA